MNPFFSSLAQRWVGLAQARGAAITPPELEREVADELLQLARVVAHGKERSFAPLATFTAGVAAERLRSRTGAGAAEVAALIRELRQELERELPPEESRR